MGQTGRWGDPIGAGRAPQGPSASPGSTTETPPCWVWDPTLSAVRSSTAPRQPRVTPLWRSPQPTRWGCPGEGCPRVGAAGGPGLVTGSRGGPNSPPGHKAAAPGVASAQRSARCWPSPAHDGAGDGGTSLRAPRPLTDRETEARSAPAHGEAASGSPEQEPVEENHWQPSKQRSFLQGCGKRRKNWGWWSRERPGCSVVCPEAAAGNPAPGPVFVPKHHATSSAKRAPTGQALGSPRDRQTGLITYKIHLY